MAQIICVECGRYFNDTAAACPNCGCPKGDSQTAESSGAGSGDEFVDFYSILGIEPGASLAEVAKAYREAARNHHPDRGGSHEKMVLINDAWAVLSNPNARHAYDEWRVQRGSRRAEAEWKKESRSERERAQQYPRDWSSFERWVDAVVRDFAAAEYGAVGDTKAWPGFPTAGKSVSGWALIVAGGALGLLLLVLFRAHVNSIGGKGAKLPGAMWFIVAAGGAWVGVKLHKVFRGTFLNETEVAEGKGPGRDEKAIAAQSGAAKHRPPNASPKPSASDVLECVSCGRRLRVPRLGKNITVTCPSCKARFDYITRPPKERLDP